MKFFLDAARLTTVGAAVLMCTQLEARGAVRDDQLPPQRPALVMPAPTKAAFMAIVHRADRVIAVGERGLVLWSADRGKTWKQAQVPVSVSLTSLRFVDDRVVVAAGHGGVLLISRDAGQTWQLTLDGRRAADLLAANLSPSRPDRAEAVRQLQEDGPGKPFLDVHFLDARRGLAVGAYGLAFGTEDGGQSWTPAVSRLDNAKGLHLNAISSKGRNVVIVGEQGLVLHSADGGERFQRLESPYRGSWLAVSVGADGQVVVGGLGGNAYRLSLGNGAWEKIAFPEPASIVAFEQHDEGGLMYGLTQTGGLHQSRDGGRTFVAMASQGAPQATAFWVDGNDLLLTSLHGIWRAPLAQVSKATPRP